MAGPRAGFFVGFFFDPVVRRDAIVVACSQVRCVVMPAPARCRSEAFVGGDRRRDGQDQVFRLFQFVVVVEFLVRVEIGGVEPSREEIRVLHNGFHEGDRGFHPTEHIFLQRSPHAADGFFPGSATDRQLGEQRVVIGGDGVILIDCAVDADADAARREIRGDRAGTGPEVVAGIFGVDSALNGVALKRDVGLLNFQRLSGGDGDLVPHDVNCRDLFGHGVLHLDARVHFDEVVTAVLIEQEFDGAGVVVVDGPGDLGSGVAHLGPQAGREDQRGRNLNQLLMTPLDRTVPFAEVDDIAVFVRQDLKLDVMRPLDVFFDEYGTVPERRQGFAGGHFHVFAQFCVGPYHPEASPASAGAGFDHDGIACAFREGQRFPDVGDAAFGSGDDRDADVLGKIARLDLAPHGVDGLGGWTDEGDAGGLAQLREFGVFGQESVPGVDGIRPDAKGQVDDLLFVEEALHRSWADQIGFIGLLDVDAGRVGFGINRRRGDIQLAARANNPHGDFAAIGDENFLEHERSGLGHNEPRTRAIPAQGSA